MSSNILNWLIIGGIGFGAYLYMTADLGSVISNTISSVVSDIDEVERGLVDNFAENIFGADYFAKHIECNPVWIAFEETLNLVSWIAVKNKTAEIKKKVAYCRSQFFSDFFLNDLAGGDQNNLFTDASKNIVYHVPGGDYNPKLATTYSRYQIKNDTNYNFFFYLTSTDLAIAKKNYPHKFRKITSAVEAGTYIGTHGISLPTNSGVSKTSISGPIITDTAGTRAKINNHIYSGGSFQKGGKISW